MTGYKCIINIPFTLRSNIAEAGQDSIEFAVQETLKIISQGSIFISLKPEQKVAIKSLIGKKDVLTVLPTGFGKSAIHQFLVRVKEMSKKSAFLSRVLCSLFQDHTSLQTSFIDIAAEKFQ